MRCSAAFVASMVVSGTWAPAHMSTKAPHPHSLLHNDGRVGYQGTSARAGRGLHFKDGKHPATQHQPHLTRVCLPAVHGDQVWGRDRCGCALSITRLPKANPVCAFWPLLKSRNCMVRSCLVSVVRVSKGIRSFVCVRVCSCVRLCVRLCVLACSCATRVLA